MWRPSAVSIGVLATMFATTMTGQSAPTSIATTIPIRPIGSTVRVSAVTFNSIQHLRRLSDGRLLVNDPSRHQVLLLDSTLANPVVVIDSIGGHDNSYCTRTGGIIPYRGDSMLFVDATSSTLLVIDPAGRIARVMSMPVNAVNYLTSPTAYGFAGYSENFGVVFRVSGRGPQYPSIGPPEGAPEVVIKSEDSALVVAMKVATRRIDTLVAITLGTGTVTRISYNNYNVNSVNELYPVPDDWALMADGSIALLSGREYRLRWINTDGTRTESPRLPFTWRHNDDDEKARLADSINAAREKSYQDRVAAQKKALAAADSAAKEAKAANRPPAPSGPPRPPTRQSKLDFTEIPDYLPAYDRTTGSFRADADNNLWIRPRQWKPTSGGPIYDIVNRKGELVDRVQLPAGRTLIGFGPGGIVYLATRDAGATRIEEVRFRDR